jgi:hypothetical protein
MPATSNAELEQRVSTVADWILEGRRYSDLVGSCCAEFKVCRNTAGNYIERANAIARETRMKQKETMIARAADKLEKIHDKAYAREDCSAATGAVRELVKLLGLAEAEKQEVKHDLTDEFVGVFRGIVKASDKPA